VTEVTSGIRDANCPECLDSFQLGSLTVWISRPQQPRAEDYLRRPEVETPLAACLSRDEFGPPLAPLLVGPPGSGKTTLAQVVARRQERPFFRFQGNSSVTAEDFLCVGRIAPTGVEYVLQPVAAAMVLGALVLVDDIDKVDSKALSLFLPILDGATTIESTLLGGVVQVSPDFRLVFASNELESLPLFLRTRVVTFRVDYPDVGEVVRMAELHVPDTGASLTRAFLHAWKRRNGSNGSLAPREAVRIFQLAGKFGKTGQPVRGAVQAAMDAVLGSGAGGAERRG